MQNGLCRIRLSRFLPILAMLLGAFGPFAAAPAAAQTKTFTVTKRTRAAEGASASLTITLSEDAPTVGVSFTVALGFTGSSTAEAADVMPIDSPVTVPGGARTLGIAIPLTDDDMDEDEETFTVTISTTTEGWTKEGDGKDTAVVAIDNDDNAGVAFIGVYPASNLEQIFLHLNTPRTYYVVLTSRPVADVTIKTSAVFATVSPASHTFTASSANDWREPKEFTVTSGRIGNARISHTVISTDPKYTSLAGTDWDPSSGLQLYVRHVPTRLTLRAGPMPAEGGGVVTVTATLDNPASMDGMTVRLTPSGTATGEGTDYTLSSTTISIKGSQSVGTATIAVTDDSADDDGETIVLVASSSNPALTSNTLTLTIEDNDDPAPPASSNADLSGLTVSAGDLAFDSATTIYGLKVANDVTSVNLTPTVEDTGKATVTVNGEAVASGSACDAISLNEGENVIMVRVTAEDGTTLDCTVTVTRQQALSSNANLSALTVSAGELTFDSATTAYALEVAHDVTSVNLTPTVEDSTATVTVNGAAVGSGSAGHAIALKIGENVITVRVTAQDGTTKDYTVTVMRQAATFVNLSTRALVGTGDNVMIGGFIVGEALQQVLVQAVGPELADRGVANALADPVLTVTASDGTVLMMNDNWEDTQGQLVSELWGGSPNLTGGSLSSAAVLTLQPGTYTAKVEGKDGTTGVALIEVYQID